MAFIQMNLMSEALVRPVPVNVILPADKLVMPGTPKRPDKPFKTLYLLHGVFGNYSDWVCNTRIQRYAEEHDLAIVMPSGDNAFYVDQPAGHNYYGEFVGKELVELTRKIFPLSHDREDTYIGGLSMGGFGALRNGLKYSDTFGYIVVLSGALLAEQMAARTEEHPMFIESKSYAEACFGDLTKLLESDKNPKWIARELKKTNRKLPRIYIACGNQDGLLPVNREMAEFLRERGFDVSFEIGPGAHEWDFWDAYIKKGIEWLPTEKSGLGISSGNVSG